MPAKGQVPESATLKRIIRPVVISTVIGIAVCMLVLLLFSLVITSQSVPHSMIDPMALFAASAGAFVAGACCGKILRGGGLLYGAVCGAVLVFLVLSAGFSIGDTGFGVPALFRIVFIMLSAMLGGVLGVNAKRRRK